MKNCSKCIYYIQHYYFNFSCGLTAADTGHCSADKNMKSKTCPQYKENSRANKRIKDLPLGQKLYEISKYLHIVELDLEDLAKDIEINSN